jgi:hypothetical protein
VVVAEDGAAAAADMAADAAAMVVAVVVVVAAVVGAAEIAAAAATAETAGNRGHRLGSQASPVRNARLTSQNGRRTLPGKVLWGGCASGIEFRGARGRWDAFHFALLVTKPLLGKRCQSTFHQCTHIEFGLMVIESLRRGV